MKIKRFLAKDMRSALEQVKKELGADAVIMSNKKVSGGVEIVAAVDGDDDAVLPSAEPPAGAPSPAPADDSGQIGYSGLSRAALRRRAVQGARDGGYASDLARTQPDDDYSDDAPVFGRDGQSSFGGGFGGAQEAPAEQPRARALGRGRGRVPRAEQPSGDRGSFADSLSELLERQKKYADRAQGGAMPGTLAERSAMQRPQREKQAAERPSLTPERRQNEVSGHELQAMKDDIESIRKMLRYQLSGLMEQEEDRVEPVRSMIAKLLERGGFSENYARSLAKRIDSGDSLKNAWRELRGLLLDDISTGHDEILRDGGAVTLIGPTGVGKTTTIAKLAAHFAMKFGADEVALITTDHYRIGAYDQLQTYGRIMGCPVKSVSEMSDMPEVLYQFRNRRLVLIDTAGMGQRDERLGEELDRLMSSAQVPVSAYLVIPATAQRRVLDDTYARFSRVDLSGAIITKTDESMSLGDAIGVCIENGLPVSYVTTGQRVPEDLEAASADVLVQAVLDGLEDGTRDYDGGASGHRASGGRRR